MILTLARRNIVLLPLAFAAGALAQTPGTGAISGVVDDPSSRTLGGAEVVAINVETRVTRSVRTTGTGVFRFTLLPAGTYDVAVKAAAFQPATAHGIVVTVSQTTSVEVKLAIEGLQQSVTATSAPELPELESSTLGGLVDEAAIRSLPLSTRNYTQILGLSPGVIADLPTATALGNGTQNVAANGATPTSNNLQFNGIDANNLLENSAATAQFYEVGTAIPAPDSIQEFRVQTANFDAAYGRGTGANVDVITKGGSNRFHGSAWEFVRNNLLNANDFFAKLDGQPRADLKQNQFGGALGGPIWKDKTFFFGEYQRTTQVNGLGDSRTTTLPQFTANRTAAALGAQFCPAGHLNSTGQPSAGYLTQAGGNQIACDGSNISPVALAVLNAKLPNGQFAVPNPQVALPTTANQLPLGQSTFQIPAHFTEDQFSINLDHVVTSTNTLSERFFSSRSTTDEAFAPNAANVPGWGLNALNRNTMFVLADTQVITPRLINIARFGYLRYDGLAAVSNPFSAQAFGIGTPTGPAAAGVNPPSLSIGSFTLGDGGTPNQWSVTNSFVYQDTVAFSKGRHNARFGVEWKRHEIDEDQPQQADGNLFISGIEDFLLGQSATQNGSPLGSSNVGLSIAGGGIFRRDERYTDFAAFAQDDIKLTPRLTVNAGLRYEIFGAPTETHGRLTNFDPSLAVVGALPTAGTFAGYTVPANFAGTPPAGVVRTPFAGFWKTPKGDFSPRLGFVLQVTERPVLVLRGGFGAYFDQHSGNFAEQTLGQAPYATSQFVSGAQNGASTLASPFTPLIAPKSSFPIFEPLVPNGFPFIEATNPNVKDGKTEEYNLNLQHELGHGYLLQAGLVGNRSLHRPGQVEFDQAALAGPHNPVNGQTTNTSNNAAARLPFQGISEGSLLSDSIFVGNYNSLQTSLTRRMRNGFQLQLSYTWSKNLDEVNGEGGTDTFELQLPTNNQLDLRDSSYGLANDDRDQRLVLNFVYAALKLTSAPAMLRYALNGWQFSGIGLIQSGAALSIFDGNAGAVYGLLGSQLRAQLAHKGANPSQSGTLFARAGGGGGAGRYLNASAFAPAPVAPGGVTSADTDFGDSGVGLVRGPGQHNLDFAVERSFPVFDRYTFVFRAEVFNLTNTPQFGNPNTSLGFGNPLDPVAGSTASPSFGSITGEQGGPHPRIIQLAAKYLF